MTRTLALALLAPLLGSCATSQTCACAEDESALRASIRHEVLAELRSNAILAAQRDGDDTADDTAGEAELEDDGIERVRVEDTRAPARGADDPLVTIVMFSDFQCPFCSRVEPTLDRLLDEHPRDVRIVWRNNPLPFHNDALPAAEAAMEAYEQGGDVLFWRYHALLFANQGALSRADLEAYGVQAGLDAGELARALDGHAHQAAIRADQAIAARVHARGTPRFFINGRMLMGAQPFEEFDAVVRQEIALARQAMSRGVERGRLYAHFMRDAVEAPSPDDGEDDDVPPSRPVPDPSAVYRIPVDGRPSHGRADALVTIVMFSDFQCPFCARVLPTLEQLATQYGDDVRFVYRHNPLPFHTNARPAALAAEEVFQQRGASAFFRYHDLLFANQQSLERETLLDLAAQAGANRRQVERALDQDRHDAIVQADQDLAVSVGASGTPSFFINGRNVRGAQPLASFQAVIDEELVRARALVASGIPRARVYEETIANGATTPQTIGGAPAPPAPTPAAGTVYTIPLPAEPRTRGPASARVTIQIFSDFQCPFCSRLGPTLDRLVEAYPRDVRLVFRDYPLPFHPNAMPAAEAAREVFRQRGSAAFWRYHDLLFENQRQLDTDTLVSLAGQVPGVRSAAVRRALESGTHRAAVEADIQAITDAGARIGTPSCFVNGRLVQGAQPFEAFRAAVDRALADP